MPHKKRHTADGVKEVWFSDRFRAVGSRISIHLLAPAAQASEAVQDARAWLESFEQEVSRFRPDSQTSQLNQAGRLDQAGALLLACVKASLWAAELTDGLVDPLMTGRLQAAGYAKSRTDGPELGWREGLAELPRHLAQPDPEQVWRQIRIDGSSIVLPEGAQYDPGAVGKGLAADAMLLRLRQHAPGGLRACVDCGGDVAAWSADAQPPWEVNLTDPRDNQGWGQVYIQEGAVATSGVTQRMWRQDGQVRHHLLSPADGQPVNSGLAGASALGPSALEAEVRAKWALLSGNDQVLEMGGWLYPADGSRPVEV